VKFVAVLLIVAAFAAEVAFLLTGSGHPHGSPSPIGQALGPQIAGQPELALAGLVAFMLGVLLLGRRGEDQAYALREVVLALAVAAAAALTAALFVGVARSWSHPTLAVLGGGAVLEVLVAVGLGVRLAMAADKRKSLFIPGLLGAVGLAALYVLLIVKGTAH
jgi:hypothetical protein